MLFAVRQWRKDLAVIAADHRSTEAAVLDSMAADLRSMEAAVLRSTAAVLRSTAADPVPRSMALLVLHLIPVRVIIVPLLRLRPGTIRTITMATITIPELAFT